jgi:two-component system sensor histidine kinase PilS (NtrC family)
VSRDALDLRSLMAAVYSLPDLVVLLVAVYGLSLCWYALVRLNRAYIAQSYAQIGVDILLITWTVNASGGLDSYFTTMYFLEIVMAGVLLPSRRAAFATALVSSLLHGVHMDLAFYRYLPSEGMAFPDGQILAYLLGMTIFGFCAVGYLTDMLAAKWQASSVALQESTGRVAFLQAFTSHIIDSLGAGLITTDMDGSIYLFNPAAVRLSGRSAEEAVGSNIRDLFPGLGRDVPTGHFELELSRPKTRKLCLRFSVTDLTMSGRTLTGRVWVFDDVTELREMEQELRQQERMAAIGSMSAGIAHEIRNPLASITGSFNLLRTELTLGHEEERLAEIIARETERLNQTINDFLTYARPAPPKKRPVYVENLVSETVKLMRNSTTLEDNQEIKIDLDPATALVDENMMRQVFYNLLSNALKSMPDGGTVEVALRSTGDKVRISFRDSGMGMTDAEMDKLFVPFSSSFRTGTGLGLSIVYQIVSSHDGTIHVESRVGHGTTFTIELPRFVPAEAPTEVAALAPAARRA